MIHIFLNAKDTNPKYIKAKKGFVTTKSVGKNTTNTLKLKVNNDDFSYFVKWKRNKDARIVLTPQCVFSSCFPIELDDIVYQVVLKFDTSSPSLKSPLYNKICRINNDDEI